MKSGCVPCVPKSHDVSERSVCILGAVFSRAAVGPAAIERQVQFISAANDSKFRTLEPQYPGNSGALFIELLREGEKSSLREGVLYCLLAGSLLLLVAGLFQEKLTLRSNREPMSGWRKFSTEGGNLENILDGGAGKWGLSS